MASCQSSKDLGEKVTEIGVDYAEFAVPYSLKYQTNPFDVIAIGTFFNEETKETKEALWFYANDSMRVRFASLDPGRWSFTTETNNSQLNGLHGKVILRRPNDSSSNGYLVAKGKKWFWNLSEKAIVPQLAMGKRLNAYANLKILKQDIKEFLVDHGFNGLHIPSISQGWFEIEHAMGSYENIES